jgi:hypothetical protein
MSDPVNEQPMVEEVVAALRRRLLEAYRAGKQPLVEMSAGAWEKVGPEHSGFVEREPDGSWELRISVPPDPTVEK